MVRTVLLGLTALGLAACSQEGSIESGGVIVARDLCPQVAIPAGTGSITLFTMPGNTTQDALDVTAAITNVSPQCYENASEIVSVTSYDVYAQRRQAGPARTVSLPVFNTVMRGGEAVISKKVGQVTLQFPEGGLRAEASGQAQASISRAAATLPADVRRELTRKRKAGDVDAAIDPLSKPEIRAAVANASFEQLIGFQLTADQLRYNATR